MAFNLNTSILITTNKDVDAKFRIADNTARNLLITQDRVQIGHIIYHVADGRHYRLSEYPTLGSLTGVVWSEFGSGGSGDIQIYRVADNTARDALITNETIITGQLIYHITDDVYYKLEEYPTTGNLTGVVWSEFGTGSADSEVIRVADNTARDALITGENITIDNVIYHVADNQHYKLQTYPTAGSLTGVVWSNFGDVETRNEIIRVADTTERDNLITGENIILGQVIYREDTDQHWKLDTYPTAGSLTGVEWVEFGTVSTDIRRVADDTERNALITNQEINLGELIYHGADNTYYRLTEYPTLGNLGGVVWIEFGISPETKYIGLRILQSVTN